MKKMNWTHSSKGIVLGVLLAIAFVMVGTATAVTVAGTAPDAAEVGDTVEMQVTVEDPFDGQDDQWTLQGETELEGASWSVESVNVGGDRVNRVDTTGDTFEIGLDSGDGVNEVTVELQGTVPEMTVFDYRDQDAENYVAMGLSVEESGASLQGMPLEAHRFTEESREARQAIDDARDVVGEDSDELDTAITLYESEQFEEATAEANEVREDAEGAEQTRSFLLLGGGAIALLLVVGGVFYLYKQRQQDTSKLR